VDTKHYTERNPDYTDLLNLAGSIYKQNHGIIISPMKVVSEIEKSIGRTMSSGELSALLDDYVERAEKHTGSK
jgi:hypothetical protein